MFDHLLAPIRIGSLTVRNRLMLTAHRPKLSEARYLRYLEERAAGGVGLIGIPIVSETMSALVSVPVSGPLSAEDDVAPDPDSESGAAFYDEIYVPRLKTYAEVVHRHEAWCFGQVGHRGAGRVPETFQPRVAPSAVPDGFVRATPHVLTIDEIGRLVRVFARSAKRIQHAGFDGIELMAAHGYLFEQFLSPYSNRRNDRYGGVLENRVRFLDEVIAAIRADCGMEFPIGMRLTAQQEVEQGLTLTDSQQIAAHLSDRLAYINVTNGTKGAVRRGISLPYVAPMYLPPAFNLADAAAIKRTARVPVILSGRMNDPWLMERVLADGSVDMIGATRALMADPEFLKKIAAGEATRVRKCIGANECHYPDRGAACAVNAQVGREKELVQERAPRPKRVLVVGGGAAGMEAARVAARRGHDVTLVERSPFLGGQLAVLARDPRRAEMGDYIEFLSGELERSHVAVELSTEASAESIARFGPDAVVLATGSTIDIPAVPGLTGLPVVTAIDLLNGADIPGRYVLVVGGGNDHLGPPSSAELLADAGKDVLLISECLVVGEGLEPAMQHMTIQRLLDKGIEIAPLTRLVSAEGPILVQNVFSNRVRRVEGIDAIVFAGSSRAADGLASLVRSLVRETYLVGDCLAPRRLVHATLDGARVGNAL